MDAQHIDWKPGYWTAEDIHNWRKRTFGYVPLRTTLVRLNDETSELVSAVVRRLEPDEITNEVGDVLSLAADACVTINVDWDRLIRTAEYDDLFRVTGDPDGDALTAQVCSARAIANEIGKRKGNLIVSVCTVIHCVISLCLHLGIDPFLAVNWIMDRNLMTDWDAREKAKEQASRYGGRS